MKITLFSLICNVMIALGGSVCARAGDISAELEEVLATVSSEEVIPVIIRFVGEVDLRKHKDPNRAVRRSRLIRAFKAGSERSQRSLRPFLNDIGIKNKDIRSLWMINAVAVDIPAGWVEAVASRRNVKTVGLDAEIAEPAVPLAENPITEWNLDMVRAPEMWAMGRDGSSVVVAVMDSGVDIDHPDIGPKFRGGANSWYDPNGQYSEPWDSSGHGTGVTGIILGGSAGGTAIGVAPGAQWIAVKIFDSQGTTSMSLVHEGFQWLLDPDGNPNTDDAPDIVNNSWTLSGTTDLCYTEFSDDIAALKAADIAVVFSAGNTGPYFGTSVSPSNNPGSLPAGAVDAAMNIADFSARGPSACDVNSYYPALVAPGVAVKTADRTLGGLFPNSYQTVSGTSFSAPHISGAMALVLSGAPNLSVSDLEAALKDTALNLGGSINESGYGLVDPVEAYSSLDGSPDNAPPVASDDTATVPRDSEVVIDVLQNDTDPDDNIDPGSVTIVSYPTGRRARAVVAIDGKIKYRIRGGSTGTDTFSYMVYDTEGEGSNEATVTVTVE